MPGNEGSCEIKTLESIDIGGYKDISHIVSVLGNKSRLAILDAMTMHDEVCACELQQALGLPQPTITTHLRKMYDVGLIKQKEVWKYSYYFINPSYARLVSDILKFHSRTVSSPGSQPEK